ncbi:outer membrane beta-barrel protein [Marinobacter changyiensis]|uniref:outer membrane beta-barrel protein n=1 Tax=Marinobacter changyiensis TaxID=2604091 RepID=UPI001FE3B349|nr:outer membrane beta-barrel protein [Marinobacter changyiensis]
MDNRYSDNVGQASTNEQSDLETRLNVRAEHRTDPGRCNSYLSANLGYGYFHSNTFDPEVYTNGSFAGDCELAERLVWQVSDDLRQVNQNSRNPSTPENTTRKNIFRTGPRYSLELGEVDTVDLSAQYERTDFEGQDEPDSDRVIGIVAWNHLFSETLSGGVRVDTNRAELDTGEEIDRNTVSLTFGQGWVATHLSGSIGYSELERTFNGETQENDAIVGDLMLRREINPTADVYVQASRELTDTTSDFDTRFDDFEFNLQETTIVEVTALNAGINKLFSDAGSLNVVFNASRSDYLQTNNKEDVLGVSTRYSRPVVEQLSFSAGAGYSFFRYEDEGTEDDLLRLDMGLIYQLNRQLNLTGRIGRNQRTSDDVPNREYTENWLLIGVNYRFL